MGTSEFYSAVESHPSVFDSLVVDVPSNTGTSSIILFVVLSDGNELDQQLKNALNHQIKESCSPSIVTGSFFQYPLPDPRRVNVLTHGGQAFLFNDKN